MSTAKELTIIEKVKSDPAVGFCRCGCGQQTKLAPRTVTSRGWVKGQPLPFINGHNRRDSIENRFWSKVAKTNNPDDCWEWQASLLRGGYGSIIYQGVTDGAHRVAWILANGEIPDGLWVLHKCDNPRCVNVNHLFLGTNADNMQDKINKGRQSHAQCPGEKHGMHKLTDSKVEEIRDRYAQEDISQRALAREMGVHQAQIHRIVTGKSWGQD